MIRASANITLLFSCENMFNFIHVTWQLFLQLSFMYFPDMGVIRILPWKWQNKFYLVKDDTKSNQLKTILILCVICSTILTTDSSFDMHANWKSISLISKFCAIVSIYFPATFDPHNHKTMFVAEMVSVAAAMANHRPASQVTSPTVYPRQIEPMGGLGWLDSW